MHGSDAIAQLVEPTVTGLGYELWGIERQRVGPRQLIRIYIDAPDGIALEDCERVSAQVGDLLEAESAVRGDYTLEVSSPGLDRVLFHPQQWQRFIGMEVQVRLRAMLDGHRRLVGQLRAADDEQVLLATADGEKSIRHSMIEKARLVPAWPGPSTGKTRRKQSER